MEVTSIQVRGRKRAGRVRARKRGRPLQSKVGVERQQKPMASPSIEMAASYAVDSPVRGNRRRDVETDSLQAARCDRRNGGRARRKWQLTAGEFAYAAIVCTWRRWVEPGVAEYRDAI